MEILSNFNSIEVIFILILVLILFGPERLPEIAGKIGSTLSRLRSVSSQIMAEWRREAGLDEFSQEGEQLSRTVDQSVQEVRDTIRPIRSLSSLDQQTLRSKADPPENLPAEDPSGTSGRRSELQGRLEELESELLRLRSQLDDLEPPADQGDTQHG